jgi:hypothetical protein
VSINCIQQVCPIRTFLGASLMNLHREVFDVTRGQKGKFFILFLLQLSRIRNDRQSGGLDGRDPIPGKDRDFFFSTASRPTLGPTQRPVE